MAKEGLWGLHFGQGGLAKDAAGNVEGYEVFVKGLPESSTSEALTAFFSEAGPIIGEPRLQLSSGNAGLAWITFGTDAALAEAISWSGCYFESARIQVRAAKQFHTGIRPSLQLEGTHTPALCAEVVQKMVAPNTGGIYVDGTFGRGGHTRAMLAALSSTGRLHAFDMDPVAIEVGKELMAADPRFTIHHAPFSTMATVLTKLGINPSGVFMDLGISSPQFDNAGRGFRVESDGPLDLRFDQTKGVPAYEFLQQVPHHELEHIIALYGETGDAPAARRIADAICLARSSGSLPQRTREFAALVAAAKGKEYQAMHPAKMTFQAIRVHLNDEFGEIRKGVRAAFEILTDGGRIGLLTWKHSECSVLVDSFRQLESVRDSEPLLQWYRTQADARPLKEGFALEMDDVVRPSDRELKENSRSRSALLHVLRKKKGSMLSELESAAYSLPGWSNAIGGTSVVEDGDAVSTEKTTKKKKRKAIDDSDSAAENKEESREKKKKKKKKDEEDDDEVETSSKKEKKKAKKAKKNDTADEEDADEAETSSKKEKKKKKKEKKDKKGNNQEDAQREAPTNAISQPVMVLRGECGHCGGAHTTKCCTFGAQPNERFLPCAGTTPKLPCFWRRFLVPLGRASATQFDATNPRGSGRADVGIRCVSAGLFRSQGLRHSTQVCLSFEESGHTIEVSGALARGLVPDESTLAARIGKALNPKVPRPDPVTEPDRWCKSDLRGLETHERSTLEALQAALSAKEERGVQQGRVVMLVLEADGMPVAQACEQMRAGPQMMGVVVVVGDHRGSTESELAAYAEMADTSGAEVMRVSLGGHTLLASHAIVILQHYFDEMMHQCEVSKQIDYSRGKDEQRSKSKPWKGR